MSTSTASQPTAGQTTASQVAKSVRLALLTGGLLAIGFGIAVLVWPAKTAVAITGVLAFYAIVGGIVYASVGLLAKDHTTGSRVGHVLLGLLWVIAGVFAFVSLQESAAFLAVFITVMIGVMWIVEGFTALFTLGESGAKGVTIFFAIISVLAGVSLVSTPLWGAGFLWWLLGISLVVLGALNVFRALSHGGSR